MENFVQLWNTVLPTVTFVALLGIVWKISAYCTGINNKLSYLKAAVVRIEKRLFGESFIEALSPLKLTEGGLDFARKLEADKITTRLADKVEIKENANAYAIQQACMAFAKEELLALLNDDEKTHIELVAYNSGQSVESFMSIFGILLRDIWLARRGFPAGDVDIHVPHVPSQSAEKSD